MSLQIAFQWLAGLGSLYLIILLLDPEYDSLTGQEIEPKYLAKTSAKNANENTSALLEERIHRAVDLQRKVIHDDMESYQYPDGNGNGASARNFEDLVIEENGNPVKSVILATWCGGGSFLGAVLNAHPGNFYHFEPLSDFGVVQVRDPPLAPKALKRVRALLNCKYEDLDEIIEYGKTHPSVYNRNTFLWKQCTAHEGLCHNHSFHNAMCKLFPFQSMKLVRLRLDAAQEILADEKLAVKLLLLVRDPRGMIESRNHFEFCQRGPDCSEAALLCADLVSDYKIAIELLKKYPNTFKVMRYEDLMADLYERVEELSRFYGRDFHPKVKKFLDIHTATDAIDTFDVSTNSKGTPHRWKTELEFEEVEEIQRTCAAAMDHWGYLPALNATHQIEFNPVTYYDLNS